MNGEPKRGTISAERTIRVGVSDVKVKSEGPGTAAGDRSSVLAETLGHVGRSGLIEALTKKVTSEAPATPGATALTRREAADLARRIVDRLITEEQGKRS
jgi:hypothetical protein